MKSTFWDHKFPSKIFLNSTFHLKKVFDLEVLSAPQFPFWNFVFLVKYFYDFIVFICYFSPGKAVLASKGVPRQVIFCLNRPDFVSKSFICESFMFHYPYLVFIFPSLRRTFWFKERHVTTLNIRKEQNDIGIVKCSVVYKDKETIFLVSIHVWISSL